MLNYIKWELKNYFSNKYKWFIFIGIVYLFVTIIPMNRAGFITGLFLLAFSIILFISVLGSFFVGSKKAIDTFNKKTFLLESMIPQPVKKILLSKFLLGIILNLLYSFIAILGFSIIIIKGSGFDALIRMLEEIIENVSLSSFLRLSLTYILSTITFMSLIIFGYVLAKVLRPNGKGSKVLGAIIWVILLYTYGWFMEDIGTSVNNIELFIDIAYVVISVIMYFGTSWLIENKLEIYN